MKKPNKLAMALMHYPVATPRMLALLPVALLEALGMLLKHIGDFLEDSAYPLRTFIKNTFKTPAELYVEQLGIEIQELKKDKLLREFREGREAEKV